MASGEQGTMGVLVEVTEEGEVVIVNISGEGVHVLAVELWYRLYAQHPCEAHRTIEKRAREVIYVKKYVEPGSSIRVGLGVPRSQVLKLNVYLSQHGRFWVLKCVAG